MVDLDVGLWGVVCGIIILIYVSIFLLLLMVGGGGIYGIK